MVMDQMLKNGYGILITQIASDGLKEWLGKKITKDNFLQLRRDSVKYGFHIGFEGGYADTLVTDCPLFSKRLIVFGVGIIVSIMWISLAFASLYHSVTLSGKASG